MEIRKHWCLINFTDIDKFVYETGIVDSREINRIKISPQDRRNMSRGFVREGDQEEVPLVPQRAYLPPGVSNFVTPGGMDLLLKEREELIKERDNIDQVNENERRISQNFLNARLQLLNERIAEARIVDVSGKNPEEVTFGVTVTLMAEQSGKIQTIKIVGVDEAAILKGRISFISPLARALINKRAGERVVLKRDRDEMVFKIVEITCL